MEVMNLTEEERRWLKAYRETIEQRFPGLVEEVLIFGSKARGEGTADSDIDILLVISAGGWVEKDAVTEPGYLSSIGTAVVPSFMVLTRAEWDDRKDKRTPIWRTITRDGVAV
jgi:predicted nucleotidyltransferase